MLEGSCPENNKAAATAISLFGMDPLDGALPTNPRYEQNDGHILPECTVHSHAALTTDRGVARPGPPLQCRTWEIIHPAWLCDSVCQQTDSLSYHLGY